jgi:hypothetical protein
MFLNLEELLVDVEDLGRARPGLQDQPLFGVPQNLFQITLLSHESTIRNNPQPGKVKCPDRKQLGVT